MLTRYLESLIQQDLTRKMVFLGGPRQVGKTTLAKKTLKDPKGYLNWNTVKHRETLLKNELPPYSLLVLDEVHKYSQWRQKEFRLKSLLGFGW